MVSSVTNNRESATVAENFDLDGFLPYVLNRAAEATSLGFERRYRDGYGMLRTEWRVLFHLGRQGAMTAKGICDLAALQKTKVSRAVAALEAKGFLVRQTQAADRRQESLSLTARGQAAHADLTAQAEQFDAALAARFTAEESDVLRRCLRRLAGAR